MTCPALLVRPLPKTMGFRTCELQDLDMMGQPIPRGGDRPFVSKGLHQSATRRLVATTCTTRSQSVEQSSGDLSADIRGDRDADAVDIASPTSNVIGPST